MKVYLFFIQENDSVVDENKIYELVAYTTDSKIEKEFKSTRDMSKYFEIVKDVTKEEFKEFQKINSNKNLVYKKLLTKDANTFQSCNCLTLLTESEYFDLGNMIDVDSLIGSDLMDCVYYGNRELKNKYREALDKLLYTALHYWYHDTEEYDMDSYDISSLNIDELTVFIGIYKDYLMGVK